MVLVVTMSVRLAAMTFSEEGERAISNDAASAPRSNVIFWSIINDRARKRRTQSTHAGLSPLAARVDQSPFWLACHETRRGTPL